MSAAACPKNFTSLSPGPKLVSSSPHTMTPPTRRGRVELVPGPALAAPAPDESRLVGSNGDFAVAALGSYVILVWTKRIGEQGVVWAHRAFADQRRAHPNDKVSFLTVVQADCELSTPPEVRKALAELLSTYKDNLAGAAIAFEGEGFRMTMVRSVITAINMMTRTRFPNSVFSNTTEAIDWLHERSTSSDSAIHVHHLIATLKRIHLF